MLESIVLERILNAGKKRLLELDFTSMGITHLPAEIGNLVDLKVLILWENELTKLPKEIERLKSLETLSLSGNKLRKLPPEIGELSNLKVLYIAGNYLEELPIEISHLKKLEKLILIGNKLKELPIEIMNLKALKMINVERNPLTQPPIEIAIRGLYPIKSYFNSVLDAKELYNLKEAKILLIGEGGVGKSSLMNKLIDPGFEISPEEMSTEGISIKKWRVNTLDNSSEIKLNLWDFGGQ